MRDYSNKYGPIRQHEIHVYRLAMFAKVDPGEPRRRAAFSALDTASVSRLTEI
jgi:hypothetical protein